MASVGRGRRAVAAVGVAVAALVLCGAAALALWSPGADVRDGRHDKGRHAIWIGHGWLGDDGWFEQYAKDPEEFRSVERIEAMASRLRDHRIADVYPHLCPSSPQGDIAPVDGAQVERLLDATEGLRVMPWVGGAWGHQAHPEREGWRRRFAGSIADLLRAHPRLAGVHINIEPVPSGSAAFLEVLEAVRAALPEGKVLSVSAHPPPLSLPLPKTGWEYGYFAEVAARSDQIAVMAYNTGLVHPKLYQAQVASWTRGVLQASDEAEILIGVPTYDDEGVHHLASVEKVDSALLGIHAGLLDSGAPAHYQGAALYSAWEMDEGEWAAFRRHMLAPAP